MSFRLRITLGMIVVIALLFSIGGAALISTSFSASVEKEEQAAVSNMNLTLRMLQMAADDENWIDETKLTGTLRRIADRGMFDAVRFTKADPNHTEVLFSYGNTDPIEHFGEDAEAGTIILNYTPTEAGNPFILTASSLSVGNSVYHLLSARNLAPVYRVRNQQRTLFSRIYLILVILSAILSFLVATMLTRSLRMLGKASREIASGNLGYRSGIRSEDEIGDLSRDFDRMADQVEENMLRMKEEADRKERFMGAFTHELKTPMTSIIGYADLLRSQELSAEDQADALNYIFSEGKRLENMSLKLLDLFVADKTEVKYAAVSPKKLLADVTEHLRPVFAGAGITIDLMAGEGEAMLEPDLIRTLMINLLDNARKAMPDGGMIRVTAFHEGAEWHFAVTDSGKGMAPEEIGHITEAFYRVDKARARQEGSAGLGLALCDKIVKLHRGTLSFESEIGKGTAVHVRIPDRPERAAAE